MKKIFFSFLFCLCFISFLVAQDQDEEAYPDFGACTVFYGAEINGPVITDAEGAVNVNITYSVPSEEAERIIAAIKEYHALSKKIKAEQLSLEEQRTLVQEKEEELKTAKTKMEQERTYTTRAKSALQDDKANFLKEIENLKTELQALIASVSDGTSNEPVNQKIQELKSQGETIIRSAENCLSKDYDIIPIEDAKTGKVSYGFSLEEILDDPNYILIDEYSDGLARVKRNNKFGFYNQKGKLEIPFKYDYASNFLEGYALIENVGRWFFIDRGGEVVYKFALEVMEVDHYANDLFKVKTALNMYLFSAKEKTMIGKPIREIRELNTNGFAVAKDYGGYGIMDANGDLVIDFRFKSIEFIAGLEEAAMVETALGTFGVVDLKNKTFSVPPMYLSLVFDKDHHLFIVGGLSSDFSYKRQMYELAQYLKTSDLRLIEKKYKSITGAVNYRREQRNEKPSFVSKAKQMRSLIHTNWQNSLDISKAETSVKHYSEADVFLIEEYVKKNISEDKRNTKYGILSLNSMNSPECEYDSIGQFDHRGLAIVLENQMGPGKREKRKLGIINTKGVPLLKCQFEFISPFDRHGYAKVKKAAGLGVIDFRGRTLFDCQYESIQAHDATAKTIFDRNGFAIVKYQSNKQEKGFGLINDQGEKLIPCKYESIDFFDENGFAQITKDAKCGIINDLGEIIIACQYRSISEFMEKGTAIVSKFVGKEIWYGVIDRNGLEVIPVVFEKITIPNHQRYFLVSKTMGITPYEFQVTHQGRCISENKDSYRNFMKGLFWNKRRKHK